jgi:hypothetical protein
MRCIRPRVNGPPRIWAAELPDGALPSWDGSCLRASVCCEARRRSCAWVRLPGCAHRGRPSGARVGGRRSLSRWADLPARNSFRRVIGMRAALAIERYRRRIRFAVLRRAGGRCLSYKVPPMTLRAHNDEIPAAVPNFHEVRSGSRNAARQQVTGMLRMPPWRAEVCRGFGLTVRPRRLGL